MKISRTGITTALIAALPEAAFAAAPSTFQDLATSIATIFNAGAVMLVTATIVVYFYGIVSGIYSRSQGEATDMRHNILWGIFILFMMLSLWGIIQFLQNGLFGSVTNANGPTP